MLSAENSNRAAIEPTSLVQNFLDVVMIIILWFIWSQGLKIRARSPWVLPDIVSATEGMLKSYRQLISVELKKITFLIYKRLDLHSLNGASKFNK